jgi:serine/threonine-protein kinase
MRASKKNPGVRPRSAAARSAHGDSLTGELAGEYRILRKLGSGGFGTVYEAEHPVLKRRAAVKVLHENKSLDDVTVKRFIAEAQAASTIRHRHIVDIFSFGTLANGQLFYVMDLLDGAALDAYLDERGTLPPNVALAVLRPIAHALDALHAAGVIHRDVKPANIFLAWESSGEVIPKLLDFGLIKLLAESPVSTASDVVMGTPYYMAPEQCRGEAVDARTDVYSLGVICHELCTGKVPFPGESASAVLLDHLLKPPPRMSDLRPELPASLDAPVLAMLSKLPADRPASAGQAFEQLERAARAAGIDVAPVALHLPRPSPRPPAPEAPASGMRPSSVAAHERSAERAGHARAPLIGWGLLLAGVLVSAVVIGRLGGGKEPEPATAIAPTAEPAAEPKTAVPAAERGTGTAPAAHDAVKLLLHGAPAGAMVKLGERELGPAAEPIALDYGTTPIELTIEARGFAPRVLQVTPDHDLGLDATLTRAARSGKNRGPVSRDLENPF